jgi:predicted PurR-regulated permease PerM
MIKPTSLPRINNILLLIVLITAILYYGREILSLTVFSAFLAMLMSPLANKIEKFGISRVFSTIISVLIIIIIISSILFLISAQIAAFIEDLPEIQKKFESFVTNISSWIEQKFGVSSEQQVATIKEQAKDTITQAGGYLTGLVTSVASMVGTSLLILVFTFLFILHREKYEKFFVSLYKKEKENEAKIIIDKISRIAQQYLVGRTISIIFLTIFYTIGLLIVGIKNAFLLSAIAAIITFIPYVGPVIGGILPFFMAIISEDTFGPALGVIIVISLAQLFDNYFVEPYVVGGNVNVSPFFTIFILIVGGMLWGITGVILFLPLLGMIKIVFDNIEGMKPYANLIGDQPGSGRKNGLMEKMNNLLKRKKR